MWQNISWPHLLLQANAQDAEIMKWAADRKKAKDDAKNAKDAEDEAELLKMEADSKSKGNPQKAQPKPKTLT